MKILGLDPGLATTGWGVIEKVGSKIILCNYGVMLTLPETPLPKRLNEIDVQLTKLMKQFDVSDVAVEELFFSTNRKTAMLVAQARGVLLNRIESCNKRYASYTPLQIKSAISGYGSASKKQVQFMVKKLLNCKLTPKPDDAADALAVAICHSHSAKVLRLTDK